MTNRSLADFQADAALQENRRLTVELNELHAQLEAAAHKVDSLERLQGFATKPLSPPAWVAPKRLSKAAKAGNRAIVCTMFSDNHYDEVVNPAELSGHNAYDRVIATYRTQRYFENVVKIAREYVAGVTFEGVVMVMGGDTYSGLIHPELERTNAAAIFDSVLFWTEQIAAGISLLADEFGQVFIPTTVGNHGRLGVKWNSKTRVRDSLDWLTAKMLERHFGADDRVTFLIPDDPDVLFTVYETRFLLNHGQTGGGGGIGGIWPPLMRLNARKSQRWDYDVLVVGHWHQLVMAADQSLIINGAMKGYDEFANTMAFRPERPSQALWIVTPENGVTMQAPVLCSNRKEEGW